MRISLEKKMSRRILGKERKGEGRRVQFSNVAPGDEGVRVHNDFWSNPLYQRAGT
jgi:hypothetical protein